MPPLNSRHVRFPENWRGVYDVFRNRARREGNIILGAISMFDGAVRTNKRLSDCFTEKGLPCFSYDILNPGCHESQDVLTQQGLLLFLDALSRLEPDSLVWFAPPCSSWSFLPSSRSGRKRDGSNIHGRPSAWVHHGNCIASFLALAIEACTSLGIWVVIEQPMGSLLFQEPSVASAIDNCGMRRTTVHMGFWGSASLKPLWLVGTSPWLELLKQKDLERSRANLSGLGALYVLDEAGRSCGTADVKDSQEYPTEFSDPCTYYVL